MRERDRRRRRLSLIGLVAMLAVFAGCGGGGDPEFEDRSVHYFASPEHERILNSDAGSPSQSRSAGGIAATIRTHLARDFVYEDWYPEVREILIVSREALVATWHLGGGAETAEEVCGAVLDSRRVERVTVIYGDEGDQTVACP